MMNRRKIMKWQFIMGVVGLVLLTISLGSNVQAFNQSPQIPLFKTTLRGVGPGQIPVAAPGPLPAPVTGVKHYQILISQFQDQILPTGFNTTTLWGYNPLIPLGGGFQPQKHLGGIIVGKGRNPNDSTDKNEPIQITFHNLLFVNKHILPVDVTQQEQGDAYNATAVHLHGGLVPWISDGGPFDFFTPTGKHGLSFLNNQVLNPLALPGAAEYYYPLNQSARFMWYHDHAHGVTRLNAYAGIASAMLIRDKFEADLVANQGLPPYIETSVLSNGKIPIQELPLVFQDKIFVGQDINTQDSTWSSKVQAAAAKPGSLWYAHEYEVNQANGTGRWDLSSLANASQLPNPSIVPEFFGDTMLVNGTAFPKTTVQARRYRLRMLNACNARFLNLQLYVDDSTAQKPNPDGITLDPSTGFPTNVAFVNAATGDPSWLQIGTEGGFLAAPAKIPSNVPFVITDQAFLAGSPSLNPALVNKSLLVAPAERPDVIVDFSGYAGKSIILYTDAAAPFPLGDDRNDYFPGWNTQGQNGNPAGAFGLGNPVNAITQPGNGPNTRVLMRFDVVAATGPADPTLLLNTGTDLSGDLDPFLVSMASIKTQDPSGLPDSSLPSGTTKQPKTLNEYFDDFGRLVQILGNVDPDGNNANSLWGTPLNGSSTYLEYPAALNPPIAVGSTEEKVNAGDTQVWEIYNATGDVHPMHFHLVNVQLLNRQPVTGDVVNGFTTSGDVVLPDDNELGWKETVPMYPGTVARVIMKFNLAEAAIVDKNLKPITVKPTLLGKLFGQQPIVAGQPPMSPRTGGAEYVWHCHILEHEEHDMMHTLVVTPKP
jgi:spore coat protein A, manganese oxidase